MKKRDKRIAINASCNISALRAYCVAVKFILIYTNSLPLITLRENLTHSTGAENIFKHFSLCSLVLK